MVESGTKHHKPKPSSKWFVVVRAFHIFIKVKMWNVLHFF